MGRAPNPGAASPRVSAHVVPKGPPVRSIDRSLDPDREDEDEKTTIESGWEDEASTTIEQGEVADKLRAAGMGGGGLANGNLGNHGNHEPPRRSITNITSTNAGMLDEPTVDDQRANLALAVITPPTVVAGGTHARLLITGGNDSGQTLEIRPGKTYTIGRAIDNDIVLTDIAVSRKHFDLYADPDGWVIRDRGSGNGTIVNGNVEDQPFFLNHGDVIEIGNTQFRFDMPSAQSLSGSSSDSIGSFDDEEMSTVAGKAPPGLGRDRGHDRMPQSPQAMAVAATPTVPPQRPKTQPPPPPMRPRAASAPPYASPLSSQPLAISPSAIPRSQSPSAPPMPSTLPGQGMGGSGSGPNQQQLLQHLVQHHAMQPPPMQQMHQPPPMQQMHQPPTPQPMMGNGMQPPMMNNGMGHGMGGMQPPMQRHPTSQPMPFGYPNVHDSSGANHHHQMVVQTNGMPRDATATSLVPPTPYNGVPVAQPPPAYTAPTISRRTKLMIGGAALAIIAATVTVAIVKSGKTSTPIVVPIGSNDALTGDTVATKTPDPKPSDAKTATTTDGKAGTTATKTDTKTTGTTATPIDTKTTAVATTDGKTATPDTKTGTTDTKTATTATGTTTGTTGTTTTGTKATDTKATDSKTTTTAVATTKTTDTKATDTKSTDTKATDTKVATTTKTTPPKTDTKVATTTKTTDTKTTTRPPAVKDFSAAKAKASELYKAKNFAGAADTLKKAAASATGSELTNLKSLAGKYEQFGKYYNVGMAPGARATDAYPALVKAKNLDPEGQFQSEVKKRLGEVAGKAVGFYLAQKELENAFVALRDAEAYAGSSGTLDSARKNLEKQANDLYNQAAKEMDSDPSGAKVKLQRVLRIVDAKSPVYTKAKKLLSQ